MKASRKASKFRAIMAVIFLLPIWALFVWAPYCSRKLDRNLDERKFYLSNEPAENLCSKNNQTLSVSEATKTQNPFTQIMKSFNETGEKLFCPCCGWSGPSFELAGVGAAKRPCECPVCRSRERHRLACLELSNEALVATDLPHSFRLLHFGAQKHMEKQINKMSEVDQVSVDYFYPGYTYSDLVLKADVTDLEFPPNFAQGIIILHVLEHISSLDIALRELKRVLHPSGWIMIEVPCSEKSADCRNLENDTQRVECSGQRDHVWRFTHADFLMMVADLTCQFKDDLENELVRKAGLGGNHPCHAICRPKTN